MIIEVENAGFSYNGTDNVFDGIGFSIEQGEILSILGPNGCGKTTLLKCINALLKVGKGEIRIEGKSVRSLKRSIIGKEVGYVPQISDSTFPYTVLEMVLMGRAPHLALFSSPSARDVEIAGEAIETVGISHLMDRPYPNISGGQAQLVLIARALAAEPRALLLDEPTSHLDFRNQMVILNTLERLAQEKKMAIIMTTHYPDHALSISGKALLMGNGKGGLAGNTKDMLTERNLREVFEIDVKVISFEEGGNNVEAIVPLRKTLTSSSSMNQHN
ncbi:ABC transporter ATP-binding protein [Dehalococcoidia bacterium]|nr:ABC transporter ATP-binding protein [Dehalococcoidia bacterium]